MTIRHTATANSCGVSPMTSKLDRSEINRCLAKAIAYHDCGKEDDAQRWAIELMKALERRDILRTDLQRG